jgi:hypothetical protein
MSQLARRAVVVGGLCVSLAALGPAMSAAVAAPSKPSDLVIIVQAVTGSGSGTVTRIPDFAPEYEGRYSSTGQLGSGTYLYGTDANTATFVRSDGMILHGTTASSTDCAPAVIVFGGCAVLDLTGTADIAGAHLVVAATDVGQNGSDFQMHGTIALNRPIGYAMVDANGTTYGFGGLESLGDAHTTAATDLELTPSRFGYWIVNAAGQVFAFGDAPYLGNANGSTFSAGEKVTSLSATPSGKGYWLFTSKGRVLPFGDAGSFGDLHATTLKGGIVGSIATPTGKGYYMVGSDGGVFAFGDARFRGSMGGVKLNQPVVGLVPTANNNGYWLVAADGGVFSFNAPFHGSMGSVALNRPVVTLVPYDGAYLMIASDGGIFDFSPGPFFASLGSTSIPAPITNGAATG